MEPTSGWTQSSPARVERHDRLDVAQVELRQLAHAVELVREDLDEQRPVLLRDGEAGDAREHVDDLRGELGRHQAPILISASCGFVSSRGPSGVTSARSSVW